MTSLERKLRTALRHLGITRQTRLVVAVSGGADSTALIDALARWGTQSLIIAHFNHLLRGAESDKDEAFVNEMAARLKIPVIIEREKISDRARAEKANLEAIARMRRYAFLVRACRTHFSAFVATAHTRDDQTETILLRLLRGSGPEGWRGILARRDLELGVTLVRPLLSATREEVLAYLAHYKLTYCTDSSNLSSDLARNRVRHELLPYLRSFNPRIDEALLRTADFIIADDDYLNHLAAQLLASTSDDSKLDMRKLRSAHAAVRRRALRMWLRRVRGDLRRIGHTHLITIDALMMRGQGGQRIELPGDLCVVRRSNHLILERKETSYEADTQ